MSEFYPTTTATFYTSWVPFDDYDEPEDNDNETIAATGIPIQILTQRVNQFQPVGMRETTVKTYIGRVRGHNNVELSYRILDERTGERYSIDEIDKDHNPLGDDSWVIILRKVPANAGR